MKSEPKTVLDFLSDVPKPLPKKVLVERRRNSQYQFYALVRYYRDTLGISPQFVSYAKSTSLGILAQLEEKGLWTGRELYVLEGFAEDSLRKVSLADDVYLLAETTSGLVPEGITPKTRGRFFRLVFSQLGMKVTTGKITARALVRQDWAQDLGLEAVEAFLRKARIMGWTDEVLPKLYSERKSEPILVALKKGKLDRIFYLADRFGYRWAYRLLLRSLVDLGGYLTMSRMGQERAQMMRAMGFRADSNIMEESAKVWSEAEVYTMMCRLMQFDALMERNPELGFQIILLNAPMRVKK